MATARLYFDIRRAKIDGTYPVKIQIIHERTQKYFGTVYSLSKEEFKKIESDFRLTEPQRKIKLRLEALIKKANDIIEELNPFNFDAFALRFTSKGNRRDLIYLLKERAESQIKTEGISNANLYNQTADLLKKYNAEVSNDKELKIATVTPDWLRGFEIWALSQKQKSGKPKYSKTTINMYLIRVRAIFNDVIDKGELNRAQYPFHRPDNKKGYKLPSASNNKRALTMEEVLLIYNYQTSLTREKLSRDFFIFSYLASGMNPSDIFRLKWNDIKDGQFSFIRKKTENKNRGANKITITLNPDLNRIIKEHGSHKLNNDYVFNILTPEMTAKEVVEACKKAISFININLKKIASKIGVTDNISLYFARHSYSTIMMNNEAPLALISQQLGHADIKTTQNYLGSFATKKAEEYHSILLGKTS